MSKFLCIVAGQRSGTTALQSAIASTGYFHDFGEIFQTTDVRREGCYLDFAKEKNIVVADIATYPGARSVALDYFDSIKRIAGKKYSLIDIKFNSWGALRPFWGYSSEEPMVLRILRESGAVFAFVARKDLAAQIMSEYIARAASKWHELMSDDLSEEIIIPVGQAKQQARQIIASERLLLEILLRTKRVFPIWYEQLYKSDGCVSDNLSQFLRDQFELDASTELRPAITKNRVSKKNVVSNFKEVVDGIEAICKDEGRLEYLDPLLSN